MSSTISPKKIEFFARVQSLLVPIRSVGLLRLAIGLALRPVPSDVHQSDGLGAHHDVSGRTGFAKDSSQRIMKIKVEFLH